ncbi:MAG TPA: RHS repeat-associated core domain-containing protein, partial [Kribbella sp.]
APIPADGDITMSYYDNDLIRSIAQGGTITTFALDALDRRSAETVTIASTSAQTVRHYTDTSDNPTWATTGATATRYAELIGGDLALTVDQTGTASLTLANSHGDVVTTVALVSGTAPATSIGGWNCYDEYGNTVGSKAADTGPLSYAWLGAKQRAVTQAGLMLMGARVYNPSTGLFTSTDPVDGGGPNKYSYPTDPQNQFDLDGNRWCWRFCPSNNALVDSWYANARMGVALIGVTPLGKIKWAKRFKQYRKNPIKRLKKTYRQCRKEGVRCTAAKVQYFFGITAVVTEGKNWWRAQKRLAKREMYYARRSYSNYKLYYRCNWTCRRRFG